MNTGEMGLGNQPFSIASELVIRSIVPSDAALWLAMRRDLWPGSDDDHAAETAAFFAGTLAEPQAVLVAYRGLNMIGFAELSIREDVAGLVGKRVGYVEGLYVEPRRAPKAWPENYFTPRNRGSRPTAVRAWPAIARAAS